MSSQSVNDSTANELPDGDRELAAALTSLRPRPLTASRDTHMYEAGRRSARRASHSLQLGTPLAQ